MASLVKVDFGMFLDWHYPDVHVLPVVTEGEGMRVTIEHREESAGILGSTKHHFVDCSVEFSEEEKAIIKRATSMLIILRSALRYRLQPERPSPARACSMSLRS
jgi:hypothetical protein